MKRLASLLSVAVMSTALIVGCGPAKSNQPDANPSKDEGATKNYDSAAGGYDSSAGGNSSGDSPDPSKAGGDSTGSSGDGGSK